MAAVIDQTVDLAPVESVAVVPGLQKPFAPGHRQVRGEQGRQKRVRLAGPDFRQNFLGQVQGGCRRADHRLQRRRHRGGFGQGAAPGQGVQEAVADFAPQAVDMVGIEPSSPLTLTLSPKEERGICTIS